MRKRKIARILSPWIKIKVDGRLYEEPTPNLFSFNSRKEHVPNVEVWSTISLMRVKLFLTLGLRFLKMLFVHFQVKFLDTAKMIYSIFATKET